MPDKMWAVGDYSRPPRRALAGKGERAERAVLRSALPGSVCAAAAVFISRSKFSF